MTNSRPRKFTGFGVLPRQGHYLQQYDRHTEAKTREAYEGHNPQVKGHESGYQVVRVRKILEPLEE